MGRAGFEKLLNTVDCKLGDLKMHISRHIPAAFGSVGLISVLKIGNSKKLSQ